jgi:signal transduction histidine kinase
MDSFYLPRRRPERLIAGGRVVLAASSLFAVWLDPSEPAKYAHIAYGLLVAYLVYAAVTALLVWRMETPVGSWRLLTHAFDLLFFSLFIYFTAGTDSPFTTYFVYSLACATLRWRWRGTLWTAAVALAAFLAVGFYFGEVRADPAFQLDSFIIRGVYLAVVAALLGYLGAHEQRTRDEVGRLAAWPQRVPDHLEALVEETLRHGAGVVGAPRAALAWIEGEEPWAHLAVWHPGGVERRREPPAALQPWVAEPLAATRFLCPDLAASPPVSRWSAGDGLRRFAGPPLHPALAERFAARSLLSVPLAGETFDGRLFFFDKPAATSDDLVLAEVVAGVATARLDHFALTRRLLQVAATEERIRLARDLHDGVLQSLAGMALRLAAARRQLDEDADGGRQRLAEVQRLIAAEQRDLRFFIEELKPAPAAVEERVDGLAGRLAELIDRIEREWDLRVDLQAEGLSEPVSDALARDVYHIVREALVNAVRHGEASRVGVTIAAVPARGVSIRVHDNGRGFPFQGRMTGEALARLDAGPKTLRERVAALRGSLEVESSAAGARLDIELPPARGAA